MASFGGTVKLQGESEYKKALADITGNLKVLNSEMKVVASQYDKSDKSAENLTQQNDVLNKKIDEQKQKVDILSKALADAEQETGENSATTQKWKVELNNAQAELNKLVKDVESNEKAMEQSADATEENAESVEKFGKEAEDSGKSALSLGDIIKANLISEAIMGGLSALGGAIAGVGQKFGAFLELGESTKEMQTNMSKIEAITESTGLDADYLTDSMYALSGVLGDVGKSTEATVLLSKMSKDGKDLEANTRILTGVFAEFGESIPTEGLAEGMNATAEMGSVQGVLADALEWQGVNLDDYNAKLESMTSAEERASYIQSTLTDLYGESADAYRKNNEALIESNEAMLRYEEHLAEMGKMAMPLQTDIKNISTSLMQGFTPALQEVMPEVHALSGSFSDLIKSIMMGDEGGIEDAMVSISENIAYLVNSLSSVLPQVAELAMSLVSTLITVITDNLPYIVESGLSMLGSLLSGIGDNIVNIIPVVLSVIETLLATILENLPMILEMGIQMLVSLVQGISSMLPTLIPLAINAVLNLVDTLLDNIDLIIDAGIELILSLADGLLEALPDLVDKIPVIIDKLLTAIFDNFPLILDAGIEITIALAEGLIQAIPQLLEKLPIIIGKLINGLLGAIPQLIQAGGDLLAGLFEGLLNPTAIWNAVKSLFNGIIGGIKELFGIHSPSTVFKDEVGKNLALGLGEGFDDTMSDISTDMANAIPTEFDADINANYNTGAGYPHNSNYDMMVMAFKQALTEVKVVMNNREMGAFVQDTIERAVYA